MIISESFVLHAPRDRVAAKLLDVDAVQACVPGVDEVTVIGPDEYSAVMTVQVGPIRSSFEGTIHIDRTGAPARLAATAEGKDKAGGSSAKIAFDAQLEETSPAVTTVSTSADVKIRGRLGSFGSGVIRATSKQMLDEFVSCLDATLTSESRAAPKSRPASVPVLRTLWLALWKRVQSAVSKLRRRRERAGR
jgi:uncharacterized protein